MSKDIDQLERVKWLTINERQLMNKIRRCKND
jgi:hypothetical protein